MSRGQYGARGARVGELPRPASPSAGDDGGNWWSGDAPTPVPADDGGSWWGGPPLPQPPQPPPAPQDAAAPPVFEPMTRAETRASEEARARRNAADPTQIPGAVTEVRPGIIERARSAWSRVPPSEKTALKVGAAATGAVALAAIVIGVAVKAGRTAAVR